MGARVVSYAKAHGDDHTAASASTNMGVVYSSLGDKEQALAYYNEALPILRKGC
ncbi:MAG: tetratricopeptide repeat protein [Anaerolineales bacterium]|nr:tetratricopeptide repeat protein [Anaerolineales bacterium]